MEPADQRTVFQHYEVERRPDGSLHELGRGAMGITYKALDSNLHVPVALKVITGVLLPDAKARARFLREARAAAQLRHSNVATVYHLGQEADFCFYTMEFVDGETVEARIRRDGPMDVRTALNVCQQTARALQAAHTRGLLHRDLKPSNLMLTTEAGELLVKVIDFGLVKPLQQDSADASASLSGGLFLGTPLYASPEQCASEDGIDGRADLYSLGATLWFMLTGGPPFKGSMRTVITQHLTKAPAFETLAGQPSAIIALLRDLLAKEAADRPADAAALRTRLAEILPSLDGAASAPGVIAANPAPPPLPAPQPTTLLDLLRKRGALPPGEVAFLLPRLAALPEGVPAGELTPDLSPRNVRLRLDGPGAVAVIPETLLATSLREWPQFRVEVSPPAPSTATMESLSGTLLEIPVGTAPVTPVESLALLVYELLSGSPLPVTHAYHPLSNLGETGNRILRSALPSGERPAYLRASDFAAALARAIEDGSTYSGPVAAVLPPPLPPPLAPGNFAAGTVTPSLSPGGQTTNLPPHERWARPDLESWRTAFRSRLKRGLPRMRKWTRVIISIIGVTLLLRVVFHRTDHPKTGRKSPAIEITDDDEASPTPATPSARIVPSAAETPPPAHRAMAADVRKNVAAAIARLTNDLKNDRLPPAARKALTDQIERLRDSSDADPDEDESPAPSPTAAIPAMPTPFPATPAPATPDAPPAVRRQAPTPPTPPEPPARVPRKSASETAAARPTPRRSPPILEMQRRAIELQHRNGQLSDADYRAALRGLGN